jgi:hypothetical protein
MVHNKKLSLEETEKDEAMLRMLKRLGWGCERCDHTNICKHKEKGTCKSWVNSGIASTSRQLLGGALADINTDTVTRDLLVLKGVHR